MKVICKVNDTLTFEFEKDTENQRALFEELAQLQEIFSIHTCGKCQGSDIQYVVRTNADDDQFYELYCKKCGARFEFGCHKKTKTLFPKRKDKEGNYLPDNGWTKWDAKQGKRV